MKQLFLSPLPRSSPLLPFLEAACAPFLEAIPFFRPLPRCSVLLSPHSQRSFVATRAGGQCKGRWFERACTFVRAGRLDLRYRVGAQRRQVGVTLGRVPAGACPCPPYIRGSETKLGWCWALGTGPYAVELVAGQLPGLSWAQFWAQLLARSSVVLQPTW